MSRIKNFLAAAATIGLFGCATAKPVPEQPQQYDETAVFNRYDKNNFYLTYCEHHQYVFKKSLDEKGKYSPSIGRSRLRMIRNRAEREIVDAFINNFRSNLELKFSEEDVDMLTDGLDERLSLGVQVRSSELSVDGKPEYICFESSISQRYLRKVFGDPYVDWLIDGLTEFEKSKNPASLKQK
jgi:hypothetical protein